MLLIQARGLENMALIFTSTADVAGANPTEAEFVAWLNLIENAINNVATPDCN